MRLVFDIEANSLLDSTSLDYSKYPFRLKDTFKVHCIVFKDMDTGKIAKLHGDKLTEQRVKRILSKATELVAHNGINYDLPVLSLYFNVDYHVGSGDDDPSTLMGREIKLVDTIVTSRVLWPDRPSGHSLKEWGKRLGNLKGDYGQKESAWEEFNQEMLEYCVQDVHVTHQVYDALQKEQGEWDWSKALWMEQAICEVVWRQEHFGYGFDKEKAEYVVKDLNEKLADIEARVEPLLPPKKMSKTNEKKYIPPKNQFKKNGELSSHMVRFIENHGAAVVEKEGREWLEIYGQTLALPLETGKPVIDTEPMTLANQDDLKQYLVSLGWRPTTWGEKDLTVDSSKQKVKREQYQKRVERYCEETALSEFKKYRLEPFKVKSVNDLYKKLIDANTDRPVRVLTAPKYTVDTEKTVCPNLEKMGEQVSFVKDVVYWLTYRHRRNSVLSPNGTGFLAQPRVDIDGRIQTPAITCGAATSRFQHKICANISRPTSIYGAPLRELFTVAKNTYQIGCDAAGLEARVEAHYTKPFPEGEQYAQDLLGEKPNDIHSVNARKMNVSRDVAKTLKYAVSYGAQPPKIAKQMDWPLSQAQQTFDDFWQAASPLAMLKEKLSAYWRRNKFIPAIDGRQLKARSEHSLVNLLFQSCGVIVMKKAAVMLDRWLQEEGLLFNPFKDSDFTGKAAEMIHYHR